MRRILFDLWYFFRPPWDTRISPPELIAYMRLHSPGAAIDLGCGTGTNVIALAAAGWRVTGVDFSAIAIRHARRRVKQAGIAADLLTADVTRPLLLPHSVDLALDIGCFHTLSDRRSYLRNLTAILKAGGHWLLYGFMSRPEEGSQLGLNPQDIELVQSQGLVMRERRDGFDRHRPSAWFLFENTTTTPGANSLSRPLD